MRPEGGSITPHGLQSCEIQGGKDLEEKGGGGELSVGYPLWNAQQSPNGVWPGALLIAKLGMLCSMVRKIQQHGRAG